MDKNNKNGMSVQEALFELMAAFADFQKLAQSDDDITATELMEKIESTYRLDLVADVVERENITRQDGFQPFSPTDTKSIRWICGSCQRQPRIKTKTKPTHTCPRCDCIDWVRTTE